MDVDALGRDADLPGVREARPEQLFGDLLGIGIGEHDRGIVAAQFQRDVLEREVDRYAYQRRREDDGADLRLEGAGVPWVGVQEDAGYVTWGVG